ncbi:MAG: nucleotidyltransferase domain-containing protein [bacterium]
MDYKEIAIRNMILKIRAGSHLFGTNTPESDLDYIGVFMPTRQMVYGFGHCEVVEMHVKAKDESGRNTADAVDFSAYEFRKFVALAMQNNPNILHLLFANEENVLEADKAFGRALLDAAPLFPHKGAHHRFVAYAHAQLHKMRIKPENYEALQRALEFLNGQDDNAVLGEFRTSNIFRNTDDTGKHLKVGDLSFEAGVFVKKARRMVAERISKATSRASLFTKYGYDTKFASNVIHLLKEGIDLMKYGRLVYPLPYADLILDIKRGVYENEQIEEMAEALTEEARRAFDGTTLPAHPRTKEIELFLMDRMERWLVSSETSRREE